MSESGDSQEHSQWHKIQELQLDEGAKVVFTAACTVLAITGVLINLPIIVTNIIHRFRHKKKSDYYTMPFSDRRDGSTLVRASVMARRSTIMTEGENRSPYFSAVSLQAKYKYSHVILALSIFNFLSSLIQIPTMALLACQFFAEDAEKANKLVILTLMWNIFQIMFVFIFQFINTSIQFLSICFPLHFSLRRSPLFTAFFLLTAVCLATAISEQVLMEDEISVELYKAESYLYENAESKYLTLARAIAIQIPFVIYWLTALLTLVMYGFIMRSIHNSQSFVRRASNPVADSFANRSRGSSMRQSFMRFWNSILRQNIQSFIMLGTSTVTLYLLELPYMLAFCSVVKPHPCIMISHLAVHTVQPMLHITLSKAFRDVFKELFLTTERTSITFMQPIVTDNLTAGE